MARGRSSEPGMYTAADYKTLIETRRLLNGLITTMDKAEQCGVNCAIWRQQRDDIDKQLEMIQTHFMSPPPAA